MNTGFGIATHYVVSCRHSGCRLRDITTYDRCKLIADAHTLASGHREISIIRYELPLGHALAT